MHRYADLDNTEAHTSSFSGYKQSLPKSVSYKLTDRVKSLSKQQSQVLVGPRAPAFSSPRMRLLVK